MEKCLYSNSVRTTINALLCVDECKCWFSFCPQCSLCYTDSLQSNTCMSTFGQIVHAILGRMLFISLWLVLYSFHYYSFNPSFSYFVFRFKVFFISLLLLLESCSLVLSFVCSFVRSFVSYSWVKTSYTHMLHGSSYVKRKYTTAYAQFVFRMLVITDNTENADNTTDLLYNKCCAV